MFFCFFHISDTTYWYIFCRKLIFCTHIYQVLRIILLRLCYIADRHRQAYGGVFALPSRQGRCVEARVRRRRSDPARAEGDVASIVSHQAHGAGAVGRVRPLRARRWDGA